MSLGEIKNLIAPGDFEVANLLCDAEIDRLLRCKREIRERISISGNLCARVEKCARPSVIDGQAPHNCPVGLYSYWGGGKVSGSVDHER